MLWGGLLPSGLGPEFDKLTGHHEATRKFSSRLKVTSRAIGVPGEVGNSLPEVPLLPKSADKDNQPIWRDETCHLQCDPNRSQMIRDACPAKMDPQNRARGASSPSPPFNTPCCALYGVPW